MVRVKGWVKWFMGKRSIKRSCKVVCAPFRQAAESGLAIWIKSGHRLHSHDDNYDINYMRKSHLEQMAFNKAQRCGILTSCIVCGRDSLPRMAAIRAVTMHYGPHLIVLIGTRSAINQPINTDNHSSAGSITPLLHR